MTKLLKLIAAILTNPKNVRFDDACKMAVKAGFGYSGGKGSHKVFKRIGEPFQLNFQNRNGYILPYQAQQLITMLKKYGADDE